MKQVTLEDLDKSTNIFIKILQSEIDNNCIKTKKDVLTHPSKEFLNSYLAYEIFFDIDKRLKPLTMLETLKTIPKTNSKYLDLLFKKNTKTLLEKKLFDEYLTKIDGTKSCYSYNNNSKIGKILTKLSYTKEVIPQKTVIKKEIRVIDVDYKKTSNKIVIFFDYTENNQVVDFFTNNCFKKELELNINIDRLNYNKFFDEFTQDFFNKSTDFAENVEPLLIKNPSFLGFF